MSNGSPSATYRGYRRQALYSLWRIVSDKDSPNRVYKPEGAEDLYIHSLDDRLLEAVQVKDLSADLTLSSFEPNEQKSYFYRVHQRLSASPATENKLVSFGPIGLELGEAIGARGARRAKAAEKLAEYSRKAKQKRIGQFMELSQVDAENVLRAIVLEMVSEQVLTSAIHEWARHTIAGFSVETTLELLVWWIFAASEQGLPITRSDVVQKVNQIGTALAALQSYHQEWERSIIQLRETTIADVDRPRLEESFARGVQATWNHILIGVDAPRDHQVASIEKKFNHSNVVIIHGASGQGKSTLAYRFLQKATPKDWRFQVIAVAGRAHALNIAAALNSHAERLGIPAHILIDVSPNDVGWVDLLTQLSANKFVRILVVVREEDYRRAHFDPAALAAEELELESISEEEASEIYDSLTMRRPVSHFLSFKDAWARFGGAGPLMEFTHLVTQGESLKKKLEVQIARLQTEASIGATGVTNSHLELLTLVAIASAYECRLRIGDVCSAVGLPMLANPFARFEKEYLIRQFSEVGEVGGLHSIRSEIILDCLIKAAPEQWNIYAVKCISFLTDRDVEGFLLRAFNRKPECTGNLCDALGRLEVCSWEKLGGIARALLWLGLSLYERENREVLKALVSVVREGWWFVFDGFICDRGENTLRGIQETLFKTMPLAQLLAERLRQTPKANVFAALQAWIKLINHPPLPPKSLRDWRGVTEIALWIGYLDYNCPLRRHLDAIDYGPVGTLPLSDLADLVYSMSQANVSVFGGWRAKNGDLLIDRFLRETVSFDLEVSSERVFVSFPLDAEGEEKEEEKAGQKWHAQTMRRVNLMRKLFPEGKVYASQGLGSSILSVNPEFDPTHKEIPAKALLNEREVFLNATFGGLVSLRHLRLPDWSSFIQRYLTMRETIPTILQALQKAVVRIMSTGNRKNLWTLVTEPEWERAKDLLNTPALPACAVDEWGFASDGRSGVTRKSEDLGHFHSVLIMAYSPFLKASNDYCSHLQTFFSQFKSASLLCLVLRATAGNHVARESALNEIGSIDERESAGRLSLLNLSEAIDSLPRFQAEFSRMFEKIVPTQRLMEIERNERGSLLKAWWVCTEFLVHPERIMSDVATFAMTADRDRRSRFLKFAQSELGKLESSGIITTLVTTCGTWDRAPAVWFSANVDDARLLPTIARQIRQGLRSAASICGFGVWEQKSVERQWHTIVVTPQFKGRAFNKCGHITRTCGLFLPASEAGSASVLAIAMPANDEDWPDELQVWTEPTPVLALVWVERTITFIVEFEQLKHLFVAAANPQRKTMAIECISEKLSAKITAAVNPAFKAFEAFRDHLSNRATVEPRVADLCTQLLGRLAALGSAMYPQAAVAGSEVTMTSDGFVAWLETIAGGADMMMEIWYEVCNGLM